MPKKVLIVDDDETVRMFVQATMEGVGWTAIEAKTGQDALDLAKSDQPDLIILDVSMPGMDGFEAFRRLRDSPFTEKIPVIFLTAVNAERGVRYTPEDLEAAYGVPAPEGFVEKPVDGAFLLQCVLGVMG